jgi:hypothetical protein
MPGRQFEQRQMAGHFLPVDSHLAQASLTEILSHHAVADTTRTFFQSFRSLEAKAPY